MQYITIATVFPKVISVALIFVFVDSENDYYLLTLFDSIGYIISGIIGLLIACRLFKIRLLLPSYKEILNQLSDGWQVFLSTLMISF